MTATRPSWLIDESVALSELLGHAAAPETAAEWAWEALRLIARRTTDLNLLMKAAKIAQRLSESRPPAWLRHVRVALLSEHTLAHWSPLLRLHLAVAGIHLDWHEAPFGQLAQPLIGDSAAMAAFGPDLVILAPDHRETQTWQAEHPGPETVAADVAHFRRLWQAAQSLGASVLHHGFVEPAITALGNLDGTASHGRRRWLRGLNLQVADAAEADGHTCYLDVAHLAHRMGLDSWSDERFWYAAKQAVSLNALPILAREQAHQIRAWLGLSAKVLALDLDNTLWGGVIGEDGVSGLELNGTARGEAFVAFQRYCRELQRRGIVLVALSKNERADALAPFREHPEMVLLESDFAAIVANWEPKSDNLIRLADTLAIGLDAVVFVDDNPVERAAMRSHLSQVTVVDLPEDPARYAAALDRLGLFEAVRLTDDDHRRAADYALRAQQEEARSGSASLAEFLQGLQQEAFIRPFQPTDLPRLHQLFQKTNQFNLTTRRHGVGELTAWMTDPTAITVSLRLQDRQGDRGLVAAAILKTEGTVAHVDSWLMSCRVLGRTVEQAMLHHLVTVARNRGCRTLAGYFRPTDRNGLVADLYARLGFTMDQEQADGSSWTLDLMTVSLPECHLTIIAASADPPS